MEYDSLFEWIPYFIEDPIALPVEAEMLTDDIAYMKISTFSGDYNLMAQVYEALYPAADRCRHPAPDH